VRNAVRTEKGDHWAMESQQQTIQILLCKIKLQGKVAKTLDLWALNGNQNKIYETNQCS
jgi:hypothetical protein